MNFVISIEGDFHFRTVRTYEADTIEEANLLAINDDFDPCSVEICSCSVNDVELNKGN